MLQVLAATLSLLLLAGMFSRCAESEEKTSTPAAERDEAHHDLSGCSSEA